MSGERERVKADRATGPPASAYAERRRHERLQVELAAEWHRAGERHAARALDLSHGGCFLQCDVRPEPHERIWLTIHLSSVAALTSLAEVRHRGPAGFGARFLEHTDEQRALLDDAWRRISRHG
jgi:hypothetical protein